MIKANELRLGNLVYWKDLIDKIESIDYDYPDSTDYMVMFIDYKGGLCHEYLNKLNPIPITPKILEKCGFEKAKHEYYKGPISCDLDCTKFFICDSEDYLIKTSQSKYLHQLQNLYFALTGEELQINL